MQRISLNVKGMRCRKCEQKACRKLLSIKGVKAASASYENEIITAIYDETAADMKEMLDGITYSGFFVV